MRLFMGNRKDFVHQGLSYPVHLLDLFASQILVVDSGQDGHIRPEAGGKRLGKTPRGPLILMSGPIQDAGGRRHAGRILRPSLGTANTTEPMWDRTLP